MPGKGREVGLGGGGALVGHEQGLGVVGMGLLTNGVTGCSRGLVCRSAGVAAGDGLVTAPLGLVCRSWTRDGG